MLGLGFHLPVLSSLRRTVGLPPATLPSAMAAPVVTSVSSTQLSVDRAAAPFDGGSPITSYDLRWSTDQTTWTTVIGVADPQTVGSLTSNTRYYVQTRAVNAVGAGAWSPSGSATTQVATTVPAAMAAPVVTAVSSSSLSVDRAAAPADGGSPITSYDLRWSTDQTTWATVVGATDPQTVGSLSSNTLYYVQTRAVNAVGAGAWSPSGSATTQVATTVPAAMAAPAVAATGSSVLTVDRAVAPADGGSPITGYELRWSTDQTTWSIASMTTTPDTITGLLASTLYYVQTRAVNAVGAGAWSPSGSATTQAAGDTTAPVLTAPSATATGPTSADLAVTTNEGNGVLYWVVTDSVTKPTTAQIKAGNDHLGVAADAFGNLTVTSTGTKTASTSSLTPASTRYAHWLQEDTALNPSTVVTTTALTLPAITPVLTGPLVVSDPSGDTSYSVDISSRQYWALFASGVSWTSGDIITGAGASDFGYFDVVSGTVVHSNNFVAGLNLTGATLAFAARVESAPQSALSNVLTATVNVNTVVASGPSLVSATGFIDDNAPTLVVNKPAGAVVGDRWILVAFVNGSARPANLPAGFSQVANYATALTCRVFERVLDGTEAASITMSNTTNQFAAWSVSSVLYRGGTGVGNTAATQVYTNAGASRTAPSITLSAASDLLTFFAQGNAPYGAMSGQEATLLAEAGASLRTISGVNTNEAAGASTPVSVLQGATANNITAVSIEVKA